MDEKDYAQQNQATAFRMARVAILLESKGVVTTMQQRVFLLHAFNQGKTFIEVMSSIVDVTDSSGQMYKRYYGALRKLMLGCSVRKDGLELLRYDMRSRSRFHRKIIPTSQGHALIKKISKILNES